MCINVLPPLNSLKSFESAARHLSFPTKLRMNFCDTSRSEPSNKIIRRFFRCRAFIRKNRSLELTEFGKAYFVDINKVLRKLNEATERLLTLKSRATFGN